MQHKYLKDVVTLELNTDRCIGCGMCLEVCPHNVFQLHSGKVQFEDRDRCMECGACVGNCPVEALAVKAGVGCASAIIRGRLTGSAPCCGGADGDQSSCCG